MILSASAIPGNESSVHRVINSLYKAGAEVHAAETSVVHVWAARASDELREMLNVVRPRHFVPGFMASTVTSRAARELATSVGIAERDISLVEDGDVLEMKGGKVRRGWSSHRRHGSCRWARGGRRGADRAARSPPPSVEDGFLMCVITIDSQNGEILAGPDLISRGFVHIGPLARFPDERRTGSSTPSRSSRARR